MRSLLLLVLLLVGCSAPIPTADVSEPELRVSNTLSPEYQDAAVAAIAAWGVGTVAIVPESEANFLAGDCFDPEAYGCAWPHELVLVDLTRMTECRWATVDGLTVCAKMPVDFLVLHEIGHWLGIEAHGAPGTVMQPALTVPMPPAELTPADRAALAEVV